MTYERRIDRLNPGLILLLVDQSDSMNEPLAGGETPKAQAVADQINQLIYELILRCVKTPREPPRPYFHLGVIGYSTARSGDPLVVSLLAAGDAQNLGLQSTTELAAAPLRIERRQGTGGGTVNAPIWVEPMARGGTPMCGALDRAGRIAATWTKRYPDTFPPIVVNLSDGEATDGRPELWAQRLQSLRTSDGTLLLFNINLSAQPSMPIVFPTDRTALPDRLAHRLLEMSSPLPSDMVHNARGQGLDVVPGSRGFAYNADLRTLALFLNVGTSVGRAAW